MSRDQEAFWLGRRYLAGNLNRRDFLRSAAVLGFERGAVSQLCLPRALVRTLQAQRPQFQAQRPQLVPSPR